MFGLVASLLHIVGRSNHTVRADIQGAATSRILIRSSIEDEQVDANACKSNDKSAACAFVSSAMRFMTTQLRSHSTTVRIEFVDA